MKFNQSKKAREVNVSSCTNEPEHTLHVIIWALSHQYEVTLDGVGCFMISQLTSFDVIRPPPHCSAAGYLIPEI